MKFSKSKKKFLLTLGLGFGAVVATVPLALSATSCFTSESLKYEKWIGREVKWTDKNGTRHMGTLIKVEGDKVWIDEFPTLSQASNINEFTLPIADDFTTLFPDISSSSKDEIKAVLTVLLPSVLFIETSYDTVEKWIKVIIEGTIDGVGGSVTELEITEEAKAIAKEMLTIFKEKMTTLTSQKWNEVISYLNDNNSLKKLDELIGYYTNTFVWAREDFFAKYNQLVKKVDASSQPSLEAIWNNASKLSMELKSIFVTASALKLSK